MEYWIQTIISFIAGGGLLTIITTRYNKKSAKIDAYVKLEDFWQASNESLRQEFQIRVQELEKRIEGLEKNVCRHIECPTRIK
ncbi:hypothetical protein JZU46_01180 [bacterium]|jgi:hypothetical protein|nr:hypothetical protein [bacterium]